MGGLLSTFRSRSDTPGINKKKNSKEIYNKIKNIYVQRHAVSCANTIEKVFGKGQTEKSKYAANSGISYVGVQQCLQVSDYFSKNPINTGANGSIKKPLLIFCCSELIRTHQTLFLSWIRYLEEYKKNKGKIIVIPWMNEVSALKVGPKIFNKDNYPDSFDKTIKDWKNFIENLETKSENIKNDTCNPDCDLGKLDQWKEWEDLFYLSPIIYKKQGNVNNRLGNNGKIIEIKRTGIGRRMGDLNQFISFFGRILNQYITNLTNQGINMNDYDGIELVIVAHHNSAEKFMEFILPSTHNIFKDQQLVNCEVVRLPGPCLSNFVQKISSDSLKMERIFPMKFNDTLSIDIDRKLVYPMFILYISKLDLFLSVNNIVKTCLKVEGMSKCVKIKGPLQIFLKISIFNYRKQLEKIKEYIRKIKYDYEKKNGPTFYDYNEMLRKIEQKMVDLNIYMTRRQTINKKFKPGQIQTSSIQNYVENEMNNQLQPVKINAQQEMENFIKRKKKNINFTKDLKEYLFDFCQLKPEEVDLLAVF